MIAIVEPPKAVQLAQEIMADPRERAYLASIPRQAGPWKAARVRKTPPRLPRGEAGSRALALAEAVCAEHGVRLEALRGPVRTRKMCGARLEFYRRARAAGVPLAVMAQTVGRLRRR